MVETTVHYPTDINLLYDAMRKVMTLTARLCELYDEAGWRHSVYHIKHVKSKMRTAQLKKRGGGRTEVQRVHRHARMLEVHQEYIEVAQRYLNKARLSLDTLENKSLSAVPRVKVIEIKRGVPKLKCY